MSDDEAASRRGFLKTLGLGAASALAPGSVQAAQAAGPVAKKVDPVVLLPDTRVAGAEHILSVAERLALRPGAPLVLRREPDNPYDKRAVVIELVEPGQEPRKIGYVHRHENRMICDLIDAGHEVAGELLGLERFTLHTRLRPGEDVGPEVRFVAHVEDKPDGSRIVQIESIRPHFRAWIATGLIASQRPPVHPDVEGDPDWICIVPEHKVKHLTYGAQFTEPVPWEIGMRLGLRQRDGGRHGPMFDIVAPGIRTVGQLEVHHETAVYQALAEGRAIRAMVSAIGETRWSGSPATPCPFIEVHASKMTKRPSDPDS
jgi:hypothetical protein